MIRSNLQIENEQLNHESKPIPFGCLLYRFIYDRHLDPRKVTMQVFRPDGEKLFGNHWDIDDWKKWVKLINSVDGDISQEAGNLFDQINAVQGKAE